jgi:hypothetical protein
MKKLIDTSIVLQIFLIAPGFAAKKVKPVPDSNLCQKGIGEYLQITPIFKDDKGRQLLGFGATWDEDLYSDDKGNVSVLFSSENVVYLYHEGSDVGGDVYRCDNNTGSTSLGVKFRGHYPSCNSVNEAIAAEANSGKVFFDYCKAHPKDE